MVRVTRVGVRVGVRVNYFRDSFSVLLRAQHYSMLMTFGSVSMAYFKRVKLDSSGYRYAYLDELTSSSNYCYYRRA